MSNRIVKKEELHQLGITGKGIKVAVIDGGFAKENENLEVKKIILDDQKVEYGEHATACASIIKSKEFGIAPECELYSLSLIDQSNSIKGMEELADRIYWCVENNISIISASIGLGTVNNKIECAKLLEACQYADNNNVIIVAGAGNNGTKESDDFGYITSPAIYDFTLSISNVDNETNKISDSSSRGYGIDFAGYGDGNTAYRVDGTKFKFAGTSSAAPYVAGCITLMKQQLKSINRIELYEVLKDNVVKLDDKIKSLQYGYGLIKPLLFEKDFDYKKKVFLERKFLFKNAYFAKNNITMKIGDSIEIPFIYAPNDDEKTSVIFKSSDNNIAIVDYQRPLVKALREGKCVITAFLGNGKQTQLIISVEEEKQEDDQKDKKSETLKSMEVYNCWDKGIKGKGINIGFIGFGCIDTPLIPIKEKYIVNNLDDQECNSGHGTRLSSLIVGKDTGIAPECNYYMINPCANTNGGTSFLDSNKCVNWALNKKLDIVFVRDFLLKYDSKYPEKFKVCYSENVEKLLQKMHDNGIIVVSIIDDSIDFGADSVIVKSPNVLTISAVTDKKEYPEKEKPLTSSNIDCVSYGYGMNVIDIDEKTISITQSMNKEANIEEYYAAAQICGILALLKQQNPDLKTAQDIRKILPQICEPLYGGKNDKTGYGLLKAKIIK